MGGTCISRKENRLNITSNLNNIKINFQINEDMKDNLRLNLNNKYKIKEQPIKEEEILKFIKETNQPFTKIEILKGLHQNTDNEKEGQLGFVIKSENNIFEDYNLILYAIDKTFMIGQLDKEIKELIIKSMSIMLFSPNQIIYKEGMLGKYFYIIKEGSAVMIKENIVLHTYQIGESFGFQALFQDYEREETIVSDSKLKVWILSRLDFKEILYNIQMKNEENKRFIDNVNVLKTLDEEQKVVLANNLIKQKYIRGDYIVYENTIGDCMYIIKSGVVNCVKNGEVLRELNKSDYFGELSLLLDIKRSLNIIAKTAVETYKIEVNMLKEVLGEDYKVILYKSFLKAGLLNTKYFSKLVENEKIFNNLFSNMEMIHFKKGEVIFKKNEQLNAYLILVITGSFSFTDSNEILCENGIIWNSKEILNSKGIVFSDDIVSFPSDCLLMKGNIKTIENNMKMSIKKQLDESALLSFLFNIESFKNIPIRYINELSRKCIMKKYSKDMIIFSNINLDNIIIYIKSGNIHIKNTDEIVFSLHSHDYFIGKRFFDTESKKLKSDSLVYDIISIDETEIILLYSKDYMNILSGYKNYNEYTKENILKYEKFSLSDEKIHLINIDSLILDYYILENQNNPQKNYINDDISIRLIKDKAGNKYFMKILNKSSNEITNCNKEYNILNHPFLRKSISILNNYHKIFFIYKYSFDYSFHSFLSHVKFLNEETSKYLIASLLCVISYLHIKKIIHKNINFDNMFISSKHYLQLDLFDISQIENNRSISITGNPFFIAPELLIGETYSYHTDYWSIGVSLYVFLYGEFPFGTKGDSPIKIYKEILYK